MPVGQVYIIGVDDWSWRRGKRFGSILVNLETHKIVDLLPDREAESVKRWLAAHPEVDVVSRDRGGCSIDGATWGASQATQIAHRWHLLSNLGEAVEAFLIRTQIRLDHGKALSEQCHKPDHPCPLFLPLLAANAVSLIRMKTICSTDGARVSVTLPSCTAKSVSADIQAVHR